jgi:hypothetical protein
MKMSTASGDWPDRSAETARDRQDERIGATPMLARRIGGWTERCITIPVDDRKIQKIVPGHRR